MENSKQETLFIGTAENAESQMFGFVKKLSEAFPGERIVNFEIEPFDEECTRILGNFYSHGKYGGVEHLTVAIVE